MATIVEGDPKAPFSIATTPRCRGGRYSFPRLLHFTLVLYLIMLSVKQGGIKYHFLSLWYDLTWDWTQVSRAIGEHSNHYWVQQPFRGWGSFSWIHWNGWIPQLRCQKYVNSFHACICPHLVFQVSIRISFLLEVCQSPVRVGSFVGLVYFSIVLTNRERTDTGWRD